MIHVRKALSKKEVEEYERWKRGHDRAIEKAAPSIHDIEKKRKSFWEKHCAAVESHLSARGGHRSTPSLPPQRDEPREDPLAGMDRGEREEYEKREAAAKIETEAKKRRVGPTYNKGGPQFWSDGMLEDLKGGGHRRR